jgi:hypothetical protein
MNASKYYSSKCEKYSLFLQNKEWHFYSKMIAAQAANTMAIDHLIIKNIKKWT